MMASLSLRAATTLVLAGPLLIACSSGSGSGAVTEAPPKEGAPCVAEGKALCPDADTELRCLGGTWKAQPCRGSRGCTGSDGRAWCDTSSSLEGTACLKDMAGACAFDGSAQLLCSNGKWAKAGACPGPRACSAAGDHVISCDGATAVSGEPCSFGGDSRENVACAADGQTALHCVANKWGFFAVCQGPQGCRAEHGKIQCDMSVTTVGTSCKTRGNAACTPDKKAVLECDGTSFRKKKDCPKGCIPGTPYITCD